MNILQLNKSHTYPATSGGEVRTWKTSEKLAELGDLWLACPDNAGVDIPHDITLVDLQTPLLRKLVREELWYSLFLLASNHPLIRLTSRRIAAAVTEQTPGVEFDVVVSESPQTIGPARLLARRHDAKLILNKHNAYYDWLSQFLDSFPSFVQTRAVANLRAYEERTIADSWATIFPAESDRQMYDIPASTQTLIVPNGCEYEQIRGRGDPEAAAAALGLDPDRFTCIFVGSYDYDPNEAAAETIIHDIAPEFPDVQFLLVGRDPPTIPADRSNVTAPGYVDDLPGTLALADVALCPLPRGSGTKLKMLDYLAAGLPIVTTSVGAQGIPVVDGESSLIRDTVGGMNDALRALLESDSLRARLAGNAAELGVEYDWNRIMTAYDTLLTPEVS